MTPQSKIATLIALGMFDLLPDITHAAAQRSERADARGDIAEAKAWLALSDAADEAILVGDAAVERV